MALPILFACSICIASYAETLRIYHIDVEQGDATLLISPTGESFLVDSGKNGHGARIKAVMDSVNLSRIDYFLATHYHEDHYGGIDELVALGVEVMKTYDRGGKDFLPSSKTNESTFKDYQIAVGYKASTINSGHRFQLGNVVGVTCISSGGIVLGEDSADFGTNENDMSVSVLVQYGSFLYFVGGDIEETTEAKIAARDLVMNIDVYQANHHGSRSSSSISFINDLHPSVVIISSGNNERYGHPRLTTLQSFTDLDPPPTVFQTNKFLGSNPKAGNVEDEFIADIETVDEDGTIVIKVDLESGSYVVSYGDTRKHFSIKDRSIGEIVIESLLPNPIGSDRFNEAVTILNNGSSDVVLRDWTLEDSSGDAWTLDDLGTLSAGMSITIQRYGMPMDLNNAGDTITLYNSQHISVDSFTYTHSIEGEKIEINH